MGIEYGYQGLVLPDRALAIDFTTSGVGAFGLSDIEAYFDQLSSRVPFSLPPITTEGAKRILDVTKGVPLAVKFTAGLYMETANVETLTHDVGRKRQIVDQMVLRYLLHTGADQQELAKLYGLALLRRADHPTAVAAAIGLSTEEAKAGYATELSRLQRRYSFIFTEKEEPALHQEVRYFLRLWLLEHGQEPHIQAVTEQLLAAHTAALQRLEERRQYRILKERLQDEDWTGQLPRPDRTALLARSR